MRLSSDRFWTEGEYFIILSQDKFPVLRIDFCLNDTEAVNCTVKPVEDDYTYNVLTNFLEEEQTWMRCFRSLPGLAGIRRKVLERSDMYAFKKLRSDYDISSTEINNHFLLVGKDNGYNMDIARAMASFFDRGLSFVHKRGSAFTENKTVNTCDDAFASGFFICIDELPALCQGNGNGTLRNILYTMRENTKDRRSSFILSGTEAEIAQLFGQAPYLKPYFPGENRFVIDDFSLEDILFEIRKAISGYSVRLTPDAWLKLYLHLKDEAQKGVFRNWDREAIDRFVREQLVCRLQKKVLRLSPYVPDGEKEPARKRRKINQAYLHETDDKRELLTRLSSDDLELSPSGQSLDDSFSSCIEELDAMVGLDDIKENIKHEFYLVRFNEMRKKMNFPASMATSHHMIFTGNPGTGKTTVAKLIGRIYHSLGILSKGGVIVTERSKLVGRYIGETEKNVLDTLQMAQGNVLFIDEAYSLYDGVNDRKDFGMRVIESLLTILSQESPDMIIIFAGYEKEMNVMMDGNTGLSGRFPHKLHFRDYTVKELLEIGDIVLSEGEFVLTSEARTAWQGFVADTCRQRDKYFSNARWVNQMIRNEMLPVVARRIMKQPENSSRVFYQTIEREDILAVVNKMTMQNKTLTARPVVVGFRT
jgi:SpoVK/Ycf46/Vps4 family AAA+-type ATPase